MSGRRGNISCSLATEACDPAVAALDNCNYNVNNDGNFVNDDDNNNNDIGNIIIIVVISIIVINSYHQHYYFISIV